VLLGASGLVVFGCQEQQLFVVVDGTGCHVAIFVVAGKYVA
jgi:hypothetical protein